MLSLIFQPKHILWFEMYPMRTILGVNETFSIFLKIYNTALWLLLRSCFWPMTDWFGEIK